MDRSRLLRDIARLGSAADDDGEVLDRCQKLEQAVLVWKETSDEQLGAKIAQARKEAGDGIEDVGQRRLAMQITEERECEYDDYGGEEEEALEPTSIANSQKRKRGEGPFKVQKKARREPTVMWVRADAISVVLPSSCVGCVLGARCAARKLDSGRGVRCQGCVQDQACLRTAVEVEVGLRKGQANDALDDLRTHLITNEVVNANIKKRSKRAKEGKAMTTRHVHTIIAKSENILVAAGEYRRAYRALVALKAPLGDEFKPLPPQAVRPFVTSGEDQRLGDSKAQPSWIWQNLRFLDTGEVMKDFEKYTEAGEYECIWFERTR